MERTTQKNIKNLISAGVATDITSLSFDEVRAIQKRERGLSAVAVGRGIYGANCAILKGFESGNLYGVTARNSTLFQVL